jgi:hypothetical protein
MFSIPVVLTRGLFTGRFSWMVYVVSNVKFILTNTRVLLENLIVPHLAKIFFAFYGIQNFITEFTKTHRSYLP